MFTTPKIENRSEQPYLSIRTLAAMPELDRVIPELNGEVFRWLTAHGIAPAGAPFIRYHVIDMENKLDIELGTPVAAPQTGNERVKPGVVPAGRYATLIYTGVDNGIPANAALLDWCAQQGLKLDQWPTDKGDAFGGRFEFFLTDPDAEPDGAKWNIEVSFRLADSA